MSLTPIDIPPGVVRNGTQYEVGTAGRWFDANLVRWVSGVLAPVGGWQQRDTAQFSGFSRDLLAWRDNSVGRYVAVGSNEGLFVASGGTTLTDITPTGFTAGRENDVFGLGYSYGPYGDASYGTAREDPDGRFIGAAGWSLDTWGEHLVACAPHDGRIVEWTLDPLVAAAVVTNAPIDCKGVLVTPERHLFALSADGNPRRVAWSDREDNTVWTPAATNAAGSLELQTSGEIRCGVKVRGQTLVLTSTDVHLVSFEGSPFVYGKERVSGTGGTDSPRSAVLFQGMAAWMANDGFYVFDGLVRKIPCDVEDFVLQGLNREQASKVVGGHNREFSEVWWFYPEGDSLEPNRYVVWNYRDNHWTIGELARTAFASPGVYRNPILAATDGFLYEHEVGYEDNGAAILDGRYAESGAVDLGNGDRVLRAKSLLPDEKTNGQTKMSFKTRFEPNGDETTHGPYDLSKRTDVRFTGRQVAVRVEGAADDAWRVGIPRLDIAEGGKR